MKKAILFSCAALLLAAACSQFPSDAANFVNGTNFYYVATNGNDDNPGTLAKPLLTIQQAVSRSRGYTGDNHRELASRTVIYVAQGVYTPGAGLNAEGSGVLIPTGYSNITLSGGWSPDFTSQNGYSTLDAQGKLSHVIMVLADYALGMNFILMNGRASGKTKYDPLLSLSNTLDGLTGEFKVPHMWYGAGLFMISKNSWFANMLFDGNIAAIWLSKDVFSMGRNNYVEMTSNRYGPGVNTGTVNGMVADERDTNGNAWSMSTVIPRSGLGADVSWAPMHARWWFGVYLTNVDVWIVDDWISYNNQMASNINIWNGQASGNYTQSDTVFVTANGSDAFAGVETNKGVATLAAALRNAKRFGLTNVKVAVNVSLSGLTVISNGAVNISGGWDGSFSNRTGMSRFVSADTNRSLASIAFVNSVRLSGFTFSGASGGGLTINYGSYWDVSNCVFDGTHLSGSYGGAGITLFGDSNSISAVFSNTVADSSTYGGGGIYVGSSWNTLRLAFSGCRQTGSSGYGGGLYLEGRSNTVSIAATNCSAGTYGAAYIQGAYNRIEAAVVGNSASNTGALGISGGANLVTGDFVSNSALSDNAGALFILNGSNMVSNCRFVGNSLTGGALPSSDNGSSGALALLGARDSVVTGSLFTGNLANSLQYEAASALYCSMSSNVSVSGCVFTNNAWRGNSGLSMTLCFNFWSFSPALLSNTVGGETAGWSGVLVQVENAERWTLAGNTLLHEAWLPVLIAGPSPRSGTVPTNYAYTNVAWTDVNDTAAANTATGSTGNAVFTTSGAAWSPAVWSDRVVDATHGNAFRGIRGGFDRLIETNTYYARRIVLLPDFEIAETETRWETWTNVTDWATNHGYSFDAPGSNGLNPETPGNPVTCVSWIDTLKWCNALSEKLGLAPVYYSDASRLTVLRSGSAVIPDGAVDPRADGYRLPTEAEWDWAARNGSTNQYQWGGASTFWTYYDQYTWLDAYATNAAGQFMTHPVGAKLSNTNGLYDLWGNVAELCFDGWDSPIYNYGQETLAFNTKGSNGTAVRTTRGGSSFALGGSYGLYEVMQFSRFPSVGSIYDGKPWAVGFRLARSRF